MFDLKQLHDLAIIDALNDALVYERPGGYEGSNINHLMDNFQGIGGQIVRSKFNPSVREVDQSESL